MPVELRWRSYSDSALNCALPITSFLNFFLLAIPPQRCRSPFRRGISQYQYQSGSLSLVQVMLPASWRPLNPAALGSWLVIYLLKWPWLKQHNPSTASGRTVFGLPLWLRAFVRATPPPSAYAEASADKSAILRPSVVLRWKLLEGSTHCRILSF